jgi:hypothetical protein
MRHLLPLVCGSFALLVAAGCGSKPTPSPVLLTPEEQAKLSTPAADKVDNPQYTQWGKFPVGTTLTRRMTTDSAKTEGQTVTTFTFKITEKTDEVVVIESQATTEYHGGRVEKNPPVTDRYPRQIALPEGVKKGEFGKPKGGTEESVTVLGRAYKARKTESKGSTDAGELTQTVWASDDIPGGLVKSVQRVPKVEETTTIEITELTIPR